MTMNLILVQAEEQKKLYGNSTVIEITSPFILNIFKFVKNATNLFTFSGGWDPIILL